MRITRLAFLLSVLCLNGCSMPARSSDFFVSSSYTQVIPLGGSKKVVVSCYCPTSTATESSTIDELQLRVVGSYSSVGYHGHQQRPSAVPVDLMQFKASEDNDELRLESREFTFIHHRFLLNRVEVLYPVGTTVSFEPVPGSELEGRRVE
jgi:hypothetical protein